MVLLLTLIAICLAGSALVPVLARWSMATMRPARAVVMTVAAAVAAALGLGASMSAVAIASVVAWGPVAREGGVSVGELRALVPVPNWLGLAAAGLVGLLLGRAVVRAAVIVTAFCGSARVCRDLPGSDPVVFTRGGDIVTLAGLPGRIVVGTELFDRLDSHDQQVVLAHERSHLRRHHHWYLHVVDIAAAANPLLNPVRGMVRLGAERWADEDAAGDGGVADRTRAARALARVALLRKKIRDGIAPAGVVVDPSGMLAAAGLQVAARVRALLEPARPARTWRMLLTATLAVAVLGAGLLALAHINGAIETAQVPSPPS